MPKDIFPSTLTNNTPKGVYTCSTDRPWPRYTEIDPDRIFQRRLKRKSWIFCSSYTADYYVGFAIVDAGYIAKAFCYVYDVKTGQRWEDSQIRPLGFPHSFNGAQSTTWSLSNYLIQVGQNDIKLHFKGRQFQIKWKIDLSTSGLLFICPSQGKNRPYHSTFKNMTCNQDLQIKTKDQLIRINSSTASIDFSHGYPPRHTRWNWLSMTGVSDCGKNIGMNLVDQFNENMENYMWIDGQVFPAGAVQFNYDKKQIDTDWSIKNDRSNINMNVHWQRSENLHIGILKSSFIQVMGSVKGTIKPPDSTLLSIHGFGVCEDHHSIW